MSRSEIDDFIRNKDAQEAATAPALPRPDRSPHEGGTGGSPNPDDPLLRRVEASKHLVEKYNLPCSPKTLAKLACVSSEGPPFRLAGRFPLYPVSGLDAWAQKKIGPLVRSTSEVRRVTETHKQKTRRHDSLAGSACAPGSEGVLADESLPSVPKKRN
jgi:hypothetical protein